MTSVTVEVEDEQGTEQRGSALAEHLFPGAVVALCGPLGAGKTCLVRAIAARLGASEEDVSSPTFVLVQTYAGRMPIHHFDAYRLEGEAEFEDLGASEYFESSGVCLVEWADRVRRSLPDDRLEIAIEATGPTSRRFTLTSRGPRHDPILAALGDQPKP
jgi:tRNA threonylcarbamoyladenosine biosynthesis protein TsaE